LDLKKLKMAVMSPLPSYPVTTRDRNGQPHQIKLIVFPGGFNWPIWVAQELGLFLRHGVQVSLSLTPGSVFQWTCLADGRADMAITLMDNVIAYREGQGEVPLAIPDAFAIMAADARALPALITLPDVRSYADLKGRALSVDAVATGLALALIALLEKGGLKAGDYTLARVGGVTQRFETLKRKEYAGALFNSPFASQLEREGFYVLDTVAGAVGHYQNHVVAARASWAEENRTAVKGFIRAFCEAIDWLYEPANRQIAFAIFERNMPGSGAGSAETAYAVLFNPTTGFVRNGSFDANGIKQVLALRTKYGAPPKALAEATAYYDTSFLDQALNAR